MTTQVTVPRRIVFIVLPQVHILDLTGPAHLFYEAKEKGAALELHYASALATEDCMTSTCGLQMTALLPFSELQLDPQDYIFIPGQDKHWLTKSSYHQSLKPFYHWLQEQYQRGAHIGSICTGAFLLAESGLLRHKRCTTHWNYLTTFAETYPQCELEGKRLFVEHDRLYTSAGVSSGIDLSLYIIEQLYGSRMALNIAREVVLYLRRSDADPQLSIYLQFRNHQEERIHRIQDYITQHLDGDLSLHTLAEAAHMSSRNLSRQFKRTTGLTIGQYIEAIRLDKIHKLLAVNEKMETIAQACGLSQADQVRELLKKYA